MHDTRQHILFFGIVSLLLTIVQVGSGTIGNHPFGFSGNLVVSHDSYFLRSGPWTQKNGALEERKPERGGAASSAAAPVPAEAKKPRFTEATRDKPNRSITGGSYRVRRGDNLSSIAQRFRVALSLLKEANGIRENSLIKAGETLVIPGLTGAQIARAAGQEQVVPTNITAKQEIGNGLLAPLSGYNWGKIHPTNATDIANNCGTPVYASHDGYVLRARIGWNGGAGNFVEITSRRGYSTFYGHLDTIYAVEGAQLTAGDLIGLVGNTGKTTGYTGCHVHFEVKGMENPLIK